MQMSERQWRILSLLQRLDRGEVTVGEAAASLGQGARSEDEEAVRWQRRPKAADSAHARYAGKDVLVKHLLSRDYRVFYRAECIAWASGLGPEPSTGSNRNNDNDE
jgi:hypothetical protein